VKHPYRSVFPIYLGLIGLSGAIALLAGALTWLDIAELQIMALPAVAFALLWILIMVITWFIGLRQIRQVTQFLASDRPLLRWTYSLPEWEAIKEARHQETQGDWKTILGCMTFIFAITGALTGLLIGFDEGVAEGIAGALAGVVIGGMAGAALGVIVGGGNALAAWRAYQAQEPEQVALGATEIYANEGYFKSDEDYRFIRGVRLETGDAATLLIIDLWNPKPRSSSEETWEIAVPPRMLSDVERVLSRIVVTSDTSAEEEVE
jgi:hypothetical protein